MELCDLKSLDNACLLILQCLKLFFLQKFRQASTLKFCSHFVLLQTTTTKNIWLLIKSSFAKKRKGGEKNLVNHSDIFFGHSDFCLERRLQVIPVHVECYELLLFFIFLLRQMKTWGICTHLEQRLVWGRYIYFRSCWRLLYQSHLKPCLHTAGLQKSLYLFCASYTRG